MLFKTTEELTREDFLKLTLEEIKDMPIEEWKMIPPEAKRGCDRCGHLISAVNLWCGNSDAKKYRGTSFPTVGHGCQFWIEESSSFWKWLCNLG